MKKAPLWTVGDHLISGGLAIECCAPGILAQLSDQLQVASRMIGGTLLSSAAESFQLQGLSKTWNAPSYAYRVLSGC